MKKLTIMLLPFFLFSCFGESDEVKKAKQELFGNTEKLNSNEIIQNGIKEENEISTGKTLEKIKSYYNINYLTTDKFIDIENILNIENITDTLDIKGTVNNPDIDKIIVSFENRDSSFPRDIYTLQTFKKGYKTFLYRAYKKYQVLDIGLNKYTIDGYVGENLVSKIELEVFIAGKNTQTGNQTQENSQSENYIPKTIGSEYDNVFLYLPIDENNYGKPIMTGESSFTYTNIPNFEVSKNSDILQTTCENFLEYLKTNYTWYYWNTCRPIYEDSFLVNVLTLTGDKYKYERHYVDRKYGFYGIVLLENGEGITQTDLQTKNEELKQKNFDIVSKTDKLFKDLLK